MATILTTGCEAERDLKGSVETAVAYPERSGVGMLRPKSTEEHPDAHQQVTLGIV
jgi:hypothetical protein